jgi:hypothetical protein
LVRILINLLYFTFNVILIKELCDQQIIGFENSLYHCIAHKHSGKDYCWGRNDLGYLGIGSEDKSYHKPTLNQYLNNEFVVDISCGAGHSLVLTNCGEVYAWGSNYYGQIGNGCNSDQLIPIKVKGFKNERVVMIRVVGDIQWHLQDVVMSTVGVIIITDNWVLRILCFQMNQNLLQLLMKINAMFSSKK